MKDKAVDSPNFSSKDVILCNQTTEQLRVTSRALKTVRYCNRVFIRATREKDLLNDVCETFVKEGGYVMAWIAFKENNEKKSVTPVAWKGMDNGYVKDLNITWADTEHGRGPTGIAIRTAKPYIVRDILNEPDFAPWRIEALKRGYGSSVSFPLIYNRRVFGALSIYAKEKNAFDSDEKELLSELSDNLAYAIMGLRLRIEHHLEHHRMQSRVKDAFSYAIGALARAAEVNDQNTGNHILRVGEYCAIISSKLKMPRNFTQAIRIQAELHDVGKIHIPQSILKKPGSLTDEEWGQMKKHTVYGSQIVGNHPFLKLASTVALTHHEKWDGSGYPYGLTGKDIPIEGRIVAMADQYDAIRNLRVYKAAFSHADTYKIITEGDGRTKPSDFDPDVLQIFKKAHLEFNKVYEALKNKISPHQYGANLAS